MKKQLRFFVITYIVLLFLGMFSCQDDDCGSFSGSRQRATAIKGSFVNYEESEESFTITPLTSEEMQFNTVAFRVNTEFETVTSEQITSTSKSFDFIKKVYACSTLLPFTNDKLLRLEIVANKDFKENFLAGSDLVSFFDLVEFDAFSEYFAVKEEASSFFKMEQKIPFQMTLVLKEAPQSSEAITFTVKLYLDSEILNFYEFDSGAIQITPSS